LRKLGLAVVLLVLALAWAGVARSQPAWAGTCGLPRATTLWVDYGWPTLAPIFGRPGIVVTASTGDYPAQMRQAGAGTVYFDLNLNKRVGTPTAPASPATLQDKAAKFFDFAAQQMGCSNPTIVENELFGASTVTPWSDGNAQYRANVLAFLQALAAKGAHPVLLINSKPYTGTPDAVAWWQQVATVADVVRESYMPATTLWKQGSLLANRTLRTRYRDAIGALTSIGIPTSRLGLMVSFATTHGFGGRNGLRPSQEWFDVAKWQALSAQVVARELGIGSVFSWGWAEWNGAERDDDKPVAACVWLWARDPLLCDGPHAAGLGFDDSRDDGQIDLPAGTQCTVDSARISNAAVENLARVTGDRDTAFTALFARTVESGLVPVSTQEVLDAERALIAERFGGSRASYLAALGSAHATLTMARAVIADELRRTRIESRLFAPPPPEREIETFYSSYPDVLVRAVEAKPAPGWLGNRGGGIAITQLAPETVFKVATGRAATIQTAEGRFRIRALGPPTPLAAVPLAQARPAIAAALREFSRGEAYERWTEARQRGALGRTTCVRDEMPIAAAVDLSTYLPFLALAG
jgi:hypothetical protein